MNSSEDTLKGKSLIFGIPWKLIFYFMLPVLLGSLLQQLYNTVDTIVVGNFVGQDPLSAVGTTGSFSFMLLAIAMGFSTGCGVIVSQYYGANKTEEIRKNASTGIILILGMSVVSTLLSFFLCEIAFRYWLAVPEELMGMAVSYFKIYSLGLIFQYGYNIIAAILRAVGDSKATLYFLVIASVINIVLDLLFVAVLGWGVEGAAYATDISQLASCAAAFIYMMKKYPVFRFGRHDWYFDWKRAFNTLKIGFPMAMQLMIVSLGFTFIQRAVNGYGKPMIASFTVAQRMETYLNMPGTSFQTALATYTGQNLGAGQVDRVKKGIKQTALMCLIFTAIVSAIVSLFTEPIVDLFGISGQATVYCVSHIRATALCMLILALYMPVFGAFQGAGHGGVSMIIVLCSLCVRVLVTYTLCYVPFFDYSIIWWNQLFGYTIGCTFTWIYYFSGKWKKRKGMQIE